VEHAGHKVKIGTSLQRLTNRTLFAAFSTWREWASHKVELQGKLQGAVGRLWHGQLAAAWQAWREHAQYSIDVKARMKVTMHIPCMNLTNHQHLRTNDWMHLLSCQSDTTRSAQCAVFA